MVGAFIAGGIVAGLVSVVLGMMLTGGRGGQLSFDPCSLAVWFTIGGIIGVVIRVATRSRKRDSEVEKLQREADELRKRQDERP